MIVIEDYDSTCTNSGNLTELSQSPPKIILNVGFDRHDQNNISSTPNMAIPDRQNLTDSNFSVSPSPQDRAPKGIILLATRRFGF